MNEQLQALQDAIQNLHELMTVLPDPKDTNIVAQCLKALTGIQHEMMVTRQQDPRNAIASQLGGAGGGQ